MGQTQSVGLLKDFSPNVQTCSNGSIATATVVRNWWSHAVGTDHGHTLLLPGWRKWTGTHKGRCKGYDPKLQQSMYGFFTYCWPLKHRKATPNVANNSSPMDCVGHDGKVRWFFVTPGRSIVELHVSPKGGKLLLLPNKHPRTGRLHLVGLNLKCPYLQWWT